MENDVYHFSLPKLHYEHHVSSGLPNDRCLNGGSCLFDEGKDTFACSCSQQWSGEKCEMEGKSKLFLFLKYDKRRIL